MTTTYVVMTHGRGRMFLFLVDRTKIKNAWWSYDWSDAIQFRERSAAQTQADKLRFKNPEVITIDQAIRLSKENHDGPETGPSQTGLDKIFEL